MTIILTLPADEESWRRPAFAPAQQKNPFSRRFDLRSLPEAEQPVSVYPFALSTAKPQSLHKYMPRPLRKTAATSLKMTPEVRDLWEQCAISESRSLTNMFEVMVRAHAKKLNIAITPATKPPTVIKKTKSSKN